MATTFQAPGALLVPSVRRKDVKADQEYKTEQGKQFHRGDYAYTPGSPSTWKLRLTNTPGGSPDPHIVGAAVAALGAGFRGRKVQIPAADRSAVVAKVRRAWHACHPGAKATDIPKVLQASAIEGKGPKGWEDTIKQMKKSGAVTNPWALSWWMRDRGMHPHQHAAHLAAALTEAAATETRSCQDLVRAAATGDPVAWLQVAAACQLLALVTK